jgi:hypothetical protein
MPVFLSCTLHLHDSQATMTIAGCVSTIDADKDMFDICLSLRIWGVPHFAPLTIQAIIDLDEDYKKLNLRFPCLFTLVWVTGHVMSVDRQVAHMVVDDVVHLSDYDRHMDSVE